MKRAAKQLGLDLRDPPRWGGRRRGAGRKRGGRAQHVARPALAARFPCHVTVKVRKDVPSLRHARFVREFERSAAQLARSDFRLVHYSLQSNHAHLVVEAKGRESLGRGMKALGARLARAVNRVFQRTGPVLLERYHLRILKSPREVRNALAYVLLNARRHLAQRRGRKVVPRPERIDPASSGAWFDGWRPEALDGLEPVRARDPVVSRPHTWLLVRGWRRHHLLDPAEIPGRA